LSSPLNIAFQKIDTPVATVVLDEIGYKWNNITEKIDVPYFLTWGWVRNWLTSLPDNLNLNFVEVYKDNVLNGAFFVGHRKVRKYNLFRRNGLFLNTTGYPDIDNIYIEYNMIPSVNSFLMNLPDLLSDINFQWEEITLPAMEEYFLSRMKRFLYEYSFIIDNKVSSYFVDLRKIKDQEDYLKLLSSNSRAQIRRSYRLYNKKGMLRLEVAASLKHALNIYEELTDLHQNTWKARGLSGAFSSPYFKEFHKKLICDRFNTGEIQMLRLALDDITIACLYNFVYRNKVYFYQSGLKYEQDPKLKPGFISHVEAILYNARVGNKEYDFLAGEEQYKKSLSTDSNSIIWARIQKKSLKFNIENSILKLYAKFLKK
jgi:hypothetical protein